MATTKILPVRKRLKDCLDYAANPKKTEVFRGNALDRLMHYTQNEDKTEHQLYVTGFNCDPQNACLIMEATKRRWHKDIGHGNVGYHIIQSFKPGEASPDQVHQIGCELARRCLADRFECTVSTHLDKGHLHNHIVVNSVSFMPNSTVCCLRPLRIKARRARKSTLCLRPRMYPSSTASMSSLDIPYPRRSRLTEKTQKPAARRPIRC